MKAIEEFNVSGKFGAETINGKVTSYSQNMKNAYNKGIKTSIVSSWENFKNKITTVIYNKHLIKKVGIALVAGTLTIGSLTGCQVAPEAKSINLEDYKPAFEVTYPVRIEYTVKVGDSLWEIAEKYSDDVQNEIYRICILNNIKAEDTLHVGVVLNLEIPNNKTNAFPSEVNEVMWNVKDNFISTTFNDLESAIGEEYTGFQSMKDIVIENQRDALKARETLTEMKALKDMYPDTDIEDKENEINNIYDLIIQKTEELTNKNYNEKEALENYNENLEQTKDIQKNR